MDLSIFESFDWRDAIMVAVIVIAVYMLLTILRLLRVRRHSPTAELAIVKHEPMQDEPHTLGDAVTVAPGFAALLPQASRKPSPIWELLDVPPKENVQPIEDTRDDSRDDSSRTDPKFDASLPHSEVDAELQVLRGDLARLSDEVAEVREGIEVLKASRNVSPLYSEAMGLAQQGHDARSIAGRCGISIGEAELVVALSRKELGFNADEESEDGDGRANADDPRR
jgi:hypothetical protein